MCISKDFLLILAMSHHKISLPVNSEIASMLCSWKEQLTVTNVLRVLFWSLFPLLWKRVDLALESPAAMVDLAVALVVLKHCETAVCILQTQGEGFLPQGSYCHRGWHVKSCEDSEGRKSNIGYRIRCPFTSWLPNVKRCIFRLLLFSSCFLLWCSPLHLLPCTL